VSFAVTLAIQGILIASFGGMLSSPYERLAEARDFSCVAGILRLRKACTLCRLYFAQDDMAVRAHSPLRPLRG
jgi:hypothetical protein